MTVTSGFFNSVSGDRLYDAKTLNELFRGLLTPGVLMGEGNALVVQEASGMNVTVTPGKAWFNDSWLNNSFDVLEAIPPADGVLNRIDIVAMDFDSTTAIRDNTVVVVSGNPAVTPVPPTLINDLDHLQVPLAHIYVGAGVGVINTVDITNKVGTSETPFATGILDSVDMDILLAQWDAEFNIWFEEMKDQLDTDAAGNLQLQVDELKPIRHAGRNKIINGDMVINQRESVTGLNNNQQYPDRWRMHTGGMPYTVTRSEPGKTYLGKEKTWLRVERDAGGTNVIQYSTLHMLENVLEASTLQEFATGSADAQSMTISFLFVTNVIGTYVINVVSVGRAIAYRLVITDADVVNEVVFTLPPQTDTPTPNDNSNGLNLRLWLEPGDYYRELTTPYIAWEAYDPQKEAQDQTAMFRNVGDYIEITDIQLEVGTKATEFERLSYDETLRKCLRYYQVYKAVIFNAITITLGGFVDWFYLNSFVLPVNTRTDVPDTAYQIVRYATASNGWDLIDTPGIYVNESFSTNNHTMVINIVYDPTPFGYSTGTQAIFEFDFTIDAEYY